MKRDGRLELLLLILLYLVGVFQGFNIAMNMLS